MAADASSPYTPPMRTFAPSNDSPSLPSSRREPPISSFDLGAAAALPIGSLLDTSTPVKVCVTTARAKSLLSAEGIEVVARRKCERSGGLAAPRGLSAMYPALLPQADAELRAAATTSVLDLAQQRAGPPPRRRLPLSAPLSSSIATPIAAPSAAFPPPPSPSTTPATTPQRMDDTGGFTMLAPTHVHVYARRRDPYAPHPTLELDDDDDDATLLPSAPTDAPRPPLHHSLAPEPPQQRAASPHQPPHLPAYQPPHQPDAGAPSPPAVRRPIVSRRLQLAALP